MLNTQLEQKESDLVALKSELEKANYQIASLNTELTTVSTVKAQLEVQTAEQAMKILLQNILSVLWPSRYYTGIQQVYNHPAIATCHLCIYPS